MIHLRLAEKHSVAANRPEAPHSALRARLAEVDGLRALAVLAVLLFHVGFAPFGGGFVGVDVFFVISGFVITRNILIGIETRSFSFREFYLRRFRRLYPALLATVVLTGVTAIFIFTPEHLLSTSSEMIAAVFSVANFLFWSGSGYFQADSLFKPLLHTWSLSLEEQYYLVWPTLVLALVSLKSTRLRSLALLTLGVLSLASSHLLVVKGFAPTAFYMLPFRAFEFIIGALLAVNPRSEIFRGRQANTAATLIGIGLIVLAVCVLDESSPFPGLWALLPAVGAAAVIFGGQNPVSRMLLGNTFAQFTGKISYSVYLVHWPIVVFFNYTHPKGLDFDDRAGMLVLAFIAGYLSWRYVEKVFRYRGRQGLCKQLPARPYVSAGLAFSLLMTLSIRITDGALLMHPHALSPAQIHAGKESRHDLLERSGCDILRIDTDPGCNLTAPEQTLVLGNSHAIDGYNTWVTAFDSPDENVIWFGSFNRCEAFVNDIAADYPDTNHCVARFSALRDKDLIGKLTSVVVSVKEPFAPDTDLTYGVVAEMKAVNPRLKVFIIGGYFHLARDCSYYMSIYGSADECLREEFIEYAQHEEQAHKATWLSGKYRERLEPVYVDKFDLVCRDGKCPSSTGGVPFTYDKHHLSLEFAQLIGAHLKQKYPARTTLELASLIGPL